MCVRYLSCLIDLNHNIGHVHISVSEVNRALQLHPRRVTVQDLGVNRKQQVS